MPHPHCMMRSAICAASRVTRPWIGQAFTAAPPGGLRQSSNTSLANTETTSAENTPAENTPAENTSADEFVRQVVGINNTPGTRDGEDKKRSPKVVRKIVSKKVFRLVPSHVPGTSDEKTEKPSSIVDRLPPTKSKKKSNGTKAALPLVRRTGVHSTKPWKFPAKLWQDKPATVFSRPAALILHGLPLETTLRDIIRAIEHAARHRKITRRAALTADIVIKSSLENSTKVDAVVEFMHPDGAKCFRDLAVQGEFKICGMVPEASLHDPKDPSEIPQLSEGDEVIEKLSKVDRAEYFASPDLRKVVRRTPLIYN